MMVVCSLFLVQVKPFYGADEADKEIALLIDSDHHENVLRYYAKVRQPCSLALLCLSAFLPFCLALRHFTIRFRPRVAGGRRGFHLPGT